LLFCLNAHGQPRLPSVKARFGQGLADRTNAPPCSTKLPVAPQNGRDFGRLIGERRHEDERKHGDRDVIFGA
jgi:hypothetical protein